MESTPEQQNELIAHFCAITGVSPSMGRELLAASGWDIDNAVAEFYPEAEPPSSEFDPEEQQGGQTVEPASSGRTLGDGSSAPSRTTVPKPARKKFATLGDLNSGDAGGAPDDDDDDDENQDLFAGGEKSGLAVQNPDDIKKKIIEKAKKALPQQREDTKPKTSYFKGTARTLGGDDAPSEVIEDPNANRAHTPEPVHRTLHFWNDGFSVDDGDLYRSDDPKNAKILEGIRQGLAPLSIMNIQPGQDVDVQIKQHDTEYVRPKGKYKAFSGAGQRLGSPTPGVTQTPVASTTTSSSAEASTGPEKPQIDESQPTVTLQIRLGDGTRLTSRFNTTNTIGDVYDFVGAASNISQQRPWALMTTFPSTELSDKSATLGDLKEYKRGGVVVQKWT